MNRSSGDNEALIGVLAEFVNITADFVTNEQEADMEGFERVRGILSEASEELRKCFREIDSILDGCGLEGRVRDQLSEQYRTSIRVLQFEDIVQQVLEHSQRQKLALVEAMKVMHKATDELKSSVTENEDFFDKVLQCKDELEDLIATHAAKNPVRQSNLDSGDVELF